MSDKILFGSGCVVQVHKDSPSIKIAGWTDKLANIQDALVVLQSIGTGENDIVLPVVAVDDYRLIYRFGKNFGNMNVEGSIFLGAPSKQTDVLKKVADAFDSIRIANKIEPTEVSASGGYKCKVYFTGLQLSGLNHENHSLRFGLSGVVAPTPGGSK